MAVASGSVVHVQIDERDLAVVVGRGRPHVVVVVVAIGAVVVEASSVARTRTFVVAVAFSLPQWRHVPDWT